MGEWVLPALLAAQGVMGGVDTLLNHEWLEKLPQRPQARGEIGLHAIREAIYAALFGGLAWFAWHGALAGLVAALLLGEMINTACDESVENRIRVLPQNERVLHVFLTLNLGAIVALSVPVLSEWATAPTGFSPRNFGLLSWLLTAFAALGVFWSARDCLAWRRLGRS
ncbi:MAG: hypothetical protein QOD26_1951 [Betaproteobacteria bacterium]|jgi:hypothetical protein|nr:hypothetical protein [Betaproteobacteria bacterium]